MLCTNKTLPVSSVDYSSSISIKRMKNVTSLHTCRTGSAAFHSSSTLFQYLSEKSSRNLKKKPFQLKCQWRSFGDIYRLMICLHFINNLLFHSISINRLVLLIVFKTIRLLLIANLFILTCKSLLPI